MDMDNVVMIAGGWGGEVVRGLNGNGKNTIKIFKNIFCIIGYGRSP